MRGACGSHIYSRVALGGAGAAEISLRLELGWLLSKDHPPHSGMDWCKLAKGYFYENLVRFLGQITRTM